MIKKFVCLIVCFSFSLFNFSQETHTINGESVTLKIEVEGSIDLLWNIIDGKYRYFVRANGNITELVNTKGLDNKFQEEYKKVLSSYTDDVQSIKKVKLTLYSLRQFIESLNLEKDPNFQIADTDAKLQAHLLFYGGITNHPLIINPDDHSNPLVGFEIEVFDAIKLPRHSLFFQLRHVLKSNDFKYSSTQLGLGYRFRVVKTEAVNFYANVLFSTYNFTHTEFEIDGEITKESDNAFDVPFSFGVGVDIRISKNSFITLSYDELFALFIEDHGNFSRHFSIGYKMSL